MTDLLFGILTGIAAEIIMLAYLLSPSFRIVLTGRLTYSQAAALVLRNLVDLFRTPVIKVKQDEHSGRPNYEITLGSVVCFNLLPLDKLLQSLPQDASITLAASESGHIIDHTAMEYLHNFQAECLREGRAFRLMGMENYYQFTPHSLSARMHDAKLVRERVRLSDRSQALAEIAARHGAPRSGHLRLAGQVQAEHLGAVALYGPCQTRPRDEQQQASEENDQQATRHEPDSESLGGCAAAVSVPPTCCLALLRRRRGLPWTSAESSSRRVRPTGLASALGSASAASTAIAGSRARRASVAAPCDCFGSPK